MLWREASWLQLVLKILNQSHCRNDGEEEVGWMSDSG